MIVSHSVLHLWLVEKILQGIPLCLSFYSIFFQVKSGLKQMFFIQDLLRKCKYSDFLVLKFGQMMLSERQKKQFFEFLVQTLRSRTSKLIFVLQYVMV